MQRKFGKAAICSGITAECVNNKWEFSGTCDVITETQTKEIVREVIVEKPVEVTKTEFITISTVPQWIYGIIIALIFIAIVLWKKRY